MSRRIIILGSTGSIGSSTLQVLSQQQAYQGEKPYDNQIVGLFANASIEKLVKQVLTYKPRFCGLFDESKEQQLVNALKHKLDAQTFSQLQIVCGGNAIADLVASSSVDVVVGAVVGFAGLETSLAALNAGKTLLLANKESLVVGGHLIKQALRNNPQAQLIPVDSEHNAIFQSLAEQAQKELCFMDLQAYGVEKILLTASGGPFLHKPLEEFATIDVAQALKHPNWAMGPKITIDSSTLMNKGLELIEACVLFNCKVEQVHTVIHPQSIIHSGVEYLDKSLIVQMGPTNMCVPIAYALNYPHRFISAMQSLDLMKLNALTFLPVDYARFPNFKLAQECYNLGFTYTCALNAANEVTVQAFLDGKIKYLDIYKYNKLTIEHLRSLNLQPEYYTYEEIYALDQQARQVCLSLITNAV
ncbi:1-deoxy-D-xylulose-5-phosphate reductoisomerase [Psittacicella hinzii]|uniref:1-deoxy-D-xylulose 5-phosphate reductoisomerase n=1 Tax=Psittacicella hinzii TaxID=2028575 RepID=A0A3A1YG55_9GAMM|nr:1-deoxy-D-xylulose-5-phosphate reductoisomerase [Psittacicella hinzii]RIY36178.1 1-deoxy-D-xylulose-5-phosphate reductoisomerase [Psittacicella hinzii]